jgi:hypothetical protein
MNKGVILPADVQEHVVDEIRHAQYGQLEAIAVKYGLTKARIYYYRKLAGVTFGSAERSAWLKTRPKRTVPNRVRMNPKRVGFVTPTRYVDLSPKDVESLRKLGYWLNVTEPLERAAVLRRAAAGDLAALRYIYARYSKLRLPCAEDRLTPSQRCQLPWLQDQP